MVRESFLSHLPIFQRGALAAYIIDRVSDFTFHTLQPRNFACKGYQSDVASGRSHAVTTIKAGQQFEVTLDGSATHGGGSCQFSLS